MAKLSSSFFHFQMRLGKLKNGIGKMGLPLTTQLSSFFFFFNCPLLKDVQSDYGDESLKNKLEKDVHLT